MGKVTGRVHYSVSVDCPHCSKPLRLNGYPYAAESTAYYDAAIYASLGMAVFGGVDTPTKWQDLSISYTCWICSKSFELTSLEV